MRLINAASDQSYYSSELYKKSCTETSPVQKYEVHYNKYQRISISQQHNTMNSQETKCSKCAESYDTAEYFRRKSDGFIHSRCLFCRSSKSELAAIMVGRDVHERYLTDRIDEVRRSHSETVDSYSSKFDEAARLHDELANELVEARRHLKAAENHNICDQVKRENEQLRAELAEMKRTMTASIEFETRELRAELKTLRRSAKKRRQKEKKRTMVASSSNDPPPPRYDEADVVPPSYQDCVSDL